MPLASVLPVSVYPLGAVFSNLMLVILSTDTTTPFVVPAICVFQSLSNVADAIACA